MFCLAHGIPSLQGVAASFESSTLTVQKQLDESKPEQVQIVWFWSQSSG